MSAAPQTASAAAIHAPLADDVAALHRSATSTLYLSSIEGSFRPPEWYKGGFRPSLSLARRWEQRGERKFSPKWKSGQSMRRARPLLSPRWAPASARLNKAPWACLDPPSPLAVAIDAGSGGPIARFFIHPRSAAFHEPRCLRHAYLAPCYLMKQQHWTFGRIPASLALCSPHLSGHTKAIPMSPSRAMAKFRTVSPPHGSLASAVT
jgi:hypothetical protein